MIGVTRVWFEVFVRILESVWQVTWSKVNRYARQSWILIKIMELHEEVKKNLKMEYLYLLADVF